MDSATDAMLREQQQAEYVVCPACDGRCELPLGDGTDEIDCWWCCGQGRVPASDAEDFEQAIAEGVRL